MDKNKKLSYRDWNFVKSSKKKLAKEKIYYTSLEEMIKKVAEMYCKFFKTRWPNLECEILVGKDGKEFNDCVAFNIGKENPELYVWVSDNSPHLFDESTFDAYDEGPYREPKWRQQL